LRKQHISTFRTLPENQTAFSTDGVRHPVAPPRHRTPPQPCAGRLAVRPAGRMQAAGRLTRRSCLGLGDRPSTAASRSATAPTLGARQREAGPLRGEKEQREAGPLRGERLMQTHEVTVINALAHAEALLRPETGTNVGQRALS